MVRTFTFAALLILTFAKLKSQTFYNYLDGDLGWPEVPADSTVIDSLEYYGDANDFSGGYNEGDTVSDFTVYDFNGSPITLSNLLKEDKPVLICNGSLTCIRFRDFFDTTVTTQEYSIPREFMLEHYDQFTWLWIYNMEAHPTDGECPSNCPTGIYIDTTVWQHPDYHYRRYCMHTWETSDNNYDFPFTMYADNPDNGIYNNFFRRPFGFLALSCEGVVTARGNWAHQFIALNQDLLTDMLETQYQSCEISTFIPLSDNREMLIYPNPSDGSVTVEGLSGIGMAVLSDRFGRIVRSIPVSSEMIRMELYDLPAGVYLLQTTMDGRMQTEKIVIY